MNQILFTLYPTNIESFIWTLFMNRQVFIYCFKVEFSDFGPRKTLFFGGWSFYPGKHLTEPGSAFLDSHSACP
ncbi:hypothetical protein L1987_44377 [Smallanthus sonchifolius]|uniref:Uncharacterized protein n=1 Tax=Smallanthus sonchifolius TaxID=185202 RepID=A0ACB9GQG9_9ASTR|nr:hypothetical protein L1987_44377 [Smallanthus sonchifolius]